MTRNNILNNRQYGFRKGVGTEDALLDITTYLHEQLNAGKKVLAVFLDISKAYDSINHQELLNQLFNIGLTNKTLNWFRSYLTDREQNIKLNNYLTQTITCHPYSIPQGTILGPGLFNIYINSLPTITCGKVFSYADDTVIVYSTNDWTTTHNTAQHDLTRVQDWYYSKSLKLNFDKSNYMTFSYNEYGQPHDSTLTIPNRLDNTNINITRTDTIRHLGIQLDSHLKWTEHAKKINKKLRHLMYIFNNLKRVISKSFLKQMYYALAQSLLQYCLVAWGGAYANVTTPLQRTQNILLRIMYTEQTQTLSYKNTLRHLPST
ncbi:hypothetical protein WDU94_013891 [Cyamophila willieti]